MVLSGPQRKAMVLSQAFERIGSEVVAMDGSLVCQYLRTESQSYSIVVYNLIAKTSLKEVLTAPVHFNCFFSPELNMVVDTIAQNFKIFLIHHDFGRMPSEFLGATMEERLKILNDPIVRVYHSASNEWQNLAYPSLAASCNQFCGVGHVSSVMFQDLLYDLFTSYPPFEHVVELWRHNLLQQAWENVAVDFSDVFGSPQLIVSANCFFLVGWTGRSKRFDLIHSRFEVSEIRIPDITRETLFTWTQEQVVEVFDINVVYRPACRHTSVLGFGNSLVFMSVLSRKSMAFDVVTRKWGRMWPQNPLGHLRLNDYSF